MLSMSLQKFTSLRDGIEEWSLKLTTCMEDEKKRVAYYQKTNGHDPVREFRLGQSSISKSLTFGVEFNLEGKRYKVSINSLVLTTKVCLTTLGDFRHIANEASMSLDATERKKYLSDISVLFSDIYTRRVQIKSFSGYTLEEKSPTAIFITHLRFLPLDPSYNPNTFGLTIGVPLSSLSKHITQIK